MLPVCLSSLENNAQYLVVSFTVVWGHVYVGKFKKLPTEIKEKIISLAKRLPQSERADFLIKISSRLGGVALEHPNTLFFAATGWAVGEIIDNLLTFHIPFSETIIELTADQASQLLMAGGSVYGFMRDHRKNDSRDMIRKIFAEEFSAHRSAQQGYLVKEV